MSQKNYKLNLDKDELYNLYLIVTSILNQKIYLLSIKDIKHMVMNHMIH